MTIDGIGGVLLQLIFAVVVGRSIAMVAMYLADEVIHLYDPRREKADARDVDRHIVRQDAYVPAHVVPVWPVSPPWQPPQRIPGRSVSQAHGPFRALREGTVYRARPAVGSPMA